MRIAIDPRTRRLLRRMPRTNIYSVAEIALLTLLAVQCARLFWTAVTPVGPIGAWQAAAAITPAPAASAELLGGFDPFFRLTGDSAPLTVTSLDLKLFGVREDRASGRGSAIIGTPDGQQRSFAVGDEIMPGVTLSAVGFDHAVIARNGTREQVFIDQSAPVEVAAPASPIPARPELVEGRSFPSSPAGREKDRASTGSARTGVGPGAETNAASGNSQ